MTAFSDHLNQCGECKFFGPCAYLKEHNGGICDNPNSDHFDHYITFTHVACSRFNALTQASPEKHKKIEGSSVSLG